MLDYEPKLLFLEKEKIKIEGRKNIEKRESAFLVSVESPLTQFVSAQHVYYKDLMV
jgi:hypothetical protein